MPRRWVCRKGAGRCPTGHGRIVAIDHVEIHQHGSGGDRTGDHPMTNESVPKKLAVGWWVCAVPLAMVSVPWSGGTSTR